VPYNTHVAAAENFSMTGRHLVEYFCEVNLAIAMLALFYWSRDLAARYNAWTSRLRSRSKILSPPPNQTILERKIKVIMILIRIVAVVVLLTTIWAAIFYK
jgi:hypothetical protein